MGGEHAEAGDGLAVPVLATSSVVKEEHLLVGDPTLLMERLKVALLISRVDLLMYKELA
jgi:hypothetical protein|tara:strand:- start:1264 stop:1440 length:177 start_codon:yes stop_codon:yes gene_type:complete